EDGHGIEQGATLKDIANAAPETLERGSGERANLLAITDTRPRSGVISFTTCLSRMLLPLPLIPIRDRNSPVGTCKLTPRKTSCCPKDFHRSMISIIVL